MIYFTWDLVKAARNLRKHSVAFEDAAEAFDDPFALSLKERDVDGEERLQLYGNAGGVLLMVAYTMTAVEDDEYVRIISARKAERKELRVYERQELQ